MKSEIKVYAKIKKNIITQIESEISSQYFDFKDTSIWTQIDEGNGDKYSHAQGMYFPKEKPLRDNQGRCNYKYIDNKVIKLTDEEKDKLFSPIPIKPSPQEEFENKIILDNINMQLQIDSLIESNLGGM